MAANKKSTKKSSTRNKKSSDFLDIMRVFLLERFMEFLLNGVEGVEKKFKEISIRMLWYKSIKTFKKKYGTEQIDIAGIPETQYKTFIKALNGFFKGKKVISKAVKIDPIYGRYFSILRKACLIVAKGRAICFGAAGDNVMVVPANRKLYVNKGLLIVICEKETIGKYWLEEMYTRGWKHKILLFVTQGFSSAEVIETLIEIQDNITDGKTNVAIGALHDIDVAGILIIEDIKKTFGKCLDLGINFEMLDSLNAEFPDCWNTLKEPHKQKSQDRKAMANLNLVDVSNRIGDFRLELDNLYVDTGDNINVFCDYTELVLDREVSVWDLNRYSRPIVYDPPEYDAQKERLESLWENIVLNATGENTWNIDWTAYADERLAEMIKANINYKGKVKDIIKAYYYIETQSLELQKIVDTNETNVEFIKEIKAAIDLINPEQFIINEDEEEVEEEY